MNFPKNKILPINGKTIYTINGYGIDKENNEILINNLKEYLTVSARVNPDAPGANIDRSFSVYRESIKRIYIPRAFGLKNFKNSSNDNLHNGIDAPNLIFKGSLRPEQQLPVDAFIKAANDPLKGGGIISVGCGFGKTVLALYLSTVFKKKTMVICHKEFLINQWKERIEQYIPTAKVGLIKAKIIDTEDKDIVLASLRSLAMKEYNPEIFKQFGFIAVDECHHTSAEVFMQALPKVTCRIMLGLSATLNRKDGLRRVFEWFLGEPVFELKKRSDNSLNITVIDYKQGRSINYGMEKNMWNGKRNTAQMINDICSYNPRTEILLKILINVLKEEPGRKTLILSDRRNHLNMFEKRIKELNLGSVGYYVGGMKETELKNSESKDIILATFSMAAEGMDVPVLNTLILASPVSSIEQPIGRIQRQKPHDRKYIPLVIDIIDNYSIFSNQAKKRSEFYKKQGYSINYITNTIDNEIIDIINDTDISENNELEKKERYEFLDESDNES